MTTDLLEPVALFEKMAGRSQSEFLPHVLDQDLTPFTGRKIFKFEGTVLNAPEPGHFMPQRLEQSSDFTVFPLGSGPLPDVIRARKSSESSRCGTGGTRHDTPLRLWH